MPSIRYYHYFVLIYLREDVLILFERVLVALATYNMVRSVLGEPQALIEIGYVLEVIVNGLNVDKPLQILTLSIHISLQ